MEQKYLEIAVNNQTTESYLANRTASWAGKKVDGKSVPSFYKEKIAALLEADVKIPEIENMPNWGTKNAFNFLQHLELQKEMGASINELKALVSLPIPALRRELLIGELDDNRPKFEFPDDFKPHRWQTEASQAWWQGQKMLRDGSRGTTRPKSGIIEVVTGAGKTVFAIRIIKQFLERDLMQRHSSSCLRRCCSTSGSQNL